MKRITNVFFAVTTVAVVFFGGCGADTGLGESVDTAAPTLEITYPPSSAVIKEHFTLAGVCDDDKSINRIEVRIRNVETQNEEDADLLSPANVVYSDDRKSWAIDINKLTDEGLYEYTDGKYELSAVVYDDAGHSSVSVSRTVEIDNTPPLFFITSPQIDDLTDTTNYGTKFKIVGTIADAHKVSKMEVVVRDEEGAVVASTDTAPLTVSNVVTAGGTSETLASYIDYTNENDLNKNYVNIYFQGEEESAVSGTKTYTCTVTLTDEAKVYREAAVADASRAAETETSADGNASSKLYAYYNIRSLVGADNFDANDMMNVLNRTYTGENAEELRAALEKEGNIQETARFTLNPKANPTYSVTGFGFSADETKLTAESAWQETTAGSVFSVVATQGLNQDPIDKNSEKAYLVGPFNPYDSLQEFVANNKTMLQALYGKMEDLSDEYRYDSTDDTEDTKAENAAYNATLYENFKTENADWLAEQGITYFEKLDMQEGKTASGSGESYTYPYVLPKELPVASMAYLFLATGRDKEGLVFSNGDNYYGFKFAVTGNAPQFKAVKFQKNDDDMTVVAANGYSNLGDMIISGKATSDSQAIREVQYALLVTDESSADNTTVAELKGTFPINAAAVKTDGEDFSIQLLENATDEQKTALLSAEKRYLYSVTLTVYDASGKSFSSQYIVHIDTKKPTIEFTGEKGVYEDTATKKKWIGASGLTELRGSIDEDNPESVTYIIKKSGAASTPITLSGGVFSFNLNNTADDGAFKGMTFANDETLQVSFTATDKAGNVTDGYVDSPVYYADVTAPVLNTTDEKKAIKIAGDPYDPASDQWRKNTALQFEGWYDETESGIAAIYYLINDNPSNKEELVKKAKGETETTGTGGAMGANKDGSFSNTIAGFDPSRTNTIYMVAADNVGNISELKSYTIKIDTIGPVFDEVEDDSRNLPSNGTEDITLSFTVREPTTASGVNLDGIVVSAFANGTEYPLSAEKIGDVAAGSVAETTVETSGDDTVTTVTYKIAKEYIKAKHTSVDKKKTDVEFSGNVTLQIVVPDNAGNVSTNQQFVLQVDGAAPVVEVIVPAKVTATDVTKINWITGKTTIQGTITDVGVAGIDGKKGKFRYMIPTVAQQTALSALLKEKPDATGAEKKTALSNVTGGSSWNDFESDVEVTWKIPYESSYLEAPTGKAGTTSAGKASLVHYGYAKDSNGTLLYGTEFGTTDTEKARYRTVPIYFYVTDLAQNEEIITDNLLYIDIEGGKPKATISYPKDKTDTNGTVTAWAKLSEEVALQGTAQDNEAVTKVALTKLWYATADASDVFTHYATDSKWTRAQSSDVKLIAVDGVELKKSDSGDLTIAQTVTGASVVEPFDIEFNVTPLAETLKTSSKKITAIKAEVTAYDENDYEYPTTRYAFIDTETPVLSDEKIVKLNKALDRTQIGSVSNGKVYDASGEALAEYEVLVERKYEADMWLSGIGTDGKTANAYWYYVGTVTDDSVVEGVTLSAQVDTDHPISFKTDGQLKPAAATTSYTFAIPIPVSTDGAMYSKLTRDDGAHKDVNSYVSLHIDNTAPAMYKTDGKTGAVATAADGGALRLIADGVLGDSYVIENSNGSFSFGDQVVEEGSGLAFVSFWFERNSKKSVYNPVVKKGNGWRTFSTSDTRSTATYTDTQTAGGVYINTEGLPALYIAATNIIVGTSGSGSNKVTTITYNGLKDNDFINHAYGMVKINGSYYKVIAIEDNTATLESDLGLSANVDVEFIYANFVDHQGTEQFAYGSSTYTVSSDEDEGKGDGIAESFKVKSGIYSWTAEFDSNNFEDGPARVHVVVVDNAGNASHAYVDTSVQNNRPRIAKVFLATDLNGSGTFYFDENAYKTYNDNKNLTFDAAFGSAKDTSNDPYSPTKYAQNDATVDDGTEIGEFVFYSTLDKNGNASSIAEIRDKGVNNNFIAKNAMLVLPEIVGGNGTTQYTYHITDAATAPVAPAQPQKTDAQHSLHAFKTGNARNLSLEKTGAVSNVTGLPANGIYFSKSDLESYESWQNGKKESRFFSFTVWDSTGSGDLTQGKDTLWSMFSVPIVVNVVDEEPPVATFGVLYWNSKEDSSTVYDEDGQPLGHVDTEKELNTTKPEVAGQIYLRGMVTDGTLISEIKIIEPEPDGTATTVAKTEGGVWIAPAYDVTAGKYYSTYFDSSSGVMVRGTYDASTKTFTKGDFEEKAISSQWPTDHRWKSFEILTEREPSQKDHMVTFRFAIDTTHWGVSDGKKFRVVAADANNTPNTSTDSETVQTTEVKPTSLYIMDFVPYIQSIALADGTEEGTSVVRSRLGRYPVQAGADIIIKGMNFSKGSSYEVHFFKTNSSGKQGDEVTAEAITGKTVETEGQVTVKAPDYSRFVQVTIGSKTTKNNNNENKGNNVEEGYIGTGTEKTAGTWGLTAANKNGTNFWTDDRYLSVWNVDTEFAGSINPHSGVIKKVTESNSENGKLFTKETGSAGVEYMSDMQETYFAALSSDDLRVYTYDLDSQTKNTISYRYTFGQNNTDIFGVPADALDCVIVSGVPYYVVQDNWVGNVDANCWGPGLYMARVGWQWNKSDLNSNGTPANATNYHVIIEKQGNSTEARNRSSAQGYDSVLQQFKNPRITGWHKDAQELMYDNNQSEYADSTDYIYISYYDSYARCLKYAAYRAGHRYGSGGKFAYVGGTWGSDVGRNSGYADLKKEMRMADDMTGGKAVVAGFDTLNNNPTQFKEEAGEWSDIMVDPDTKNPVIIYYNKTQKSLEVAVGNQAFPTHAGNVVKNGSAYNSATDNSEATTGWTKHKGITPNKKVDFGRYVSAAMDKSGNLHVAAQDATNAKLYYLYLKKSGTSYVTTTSVLVDAANGAGRWTDIELTNPSGSTPKECKPVISYINTSYLGTTQGVKVAYLESVSSDGTLNFEAMTDPAKWQAGDQRTSVLPDVKETKESTGKAIVGVGFNSDMLALDFLRGEE